MKSEKICFLTPEQSSLSAQDLSLLNSAKSEILHRPGFTEVFQPAEADAVVFQEKTSHKDWRYIRELEADPVVGRFPDKTYTINTDDGATGLLRGIYTCLSQERYDPQLHRSVAYATSPVESLYARWRRSDDIPPHLACWRGNPMSNPLRRKLQATFAGHPRIKIETTGSWFNHEVEEKDRYVNLILDGCFSLCPAGWAGVTFRIYESMALGVSPVILADSFVPPDGPTWPSFSLRVPEKNHRDLESILVLRESKAAEMGRQARLAWERHFSPQAVFAGYADALIACIHADAPRSREAELKRWRSRKMAHSNGWTIPQRLQAKIAKIFRR